MKKILFIVVVLILMWNVLGSHTKARWEGELVSLEPIQTDKFLPSPWTQGQNTIIPKARYEIQAVVLSKHRYWAGNPEDQLSPYDFALGWGPMSNAEVINQLKITQFGRWYHYSWKKPLPIDNKEMSLHSANNHILPANRKVLKQIKAVKRHDVVLLKGFLVDITKANGWKWESSLTRTDTSGGSCEVFWVESVERHPQK